MPHFLDLSFPLSDLLVRRATSPSARADSHPLVPILPFPLPPTRHSHSEKGTFVAQFFFTIALLPAGPLIISPTPVWYKPEKVKSTHAVKDEELKTLIASKLRVDKKKAKKDAKKAEGGAAVEGEKKTE